jgi:hypothetical protein
MGPTLPGATPRLDGASRLEALRATHALDTPPEENFDRLTRLAARLLRAPVALVSLVDAERQFFKSCVGLPEPWLSRRQTPLSHSFCQHVVTSAEPLIIEDARADPLVKENATVKVAAHTYVIPDGNVPLVPNVGIVVGKRATLIVDPGMGVRSGEAVARETAKVSRNSELYLVNTHFHPEHTTGEAGLPPTAKLIRARAQQAQARGEVR